MKPERAVEIVSDAATWIDPRFYVEAALYIAINPYLAMRLTLEAYDRAMKIAGYAVEHGAPAAEKLVGKARYGAGYGEQPQ